MLCSLLFMFIWCPGPNDVIWDISWRISQSWFYLLGSDPWSGSHLRVTASSEALKRILGAGEDLNIIYWYRNLFQENQFVLASYNFLHWHKPTRLLCHLFAIKMVIYVDTKHFLWPFSSFYVIVWHGILVFLTNWFRVQYLLLGNANNCTG